MSMRQNDLAVLTSLAANFPELFTGEELSGADLVDRLAALAGAVSYCGQVVGEWEIQGTGQAPTADDYEILATAIDRLGSGLQPSNDIESEMIKVGIDRGYSDNWMERLSLVPRFRVNKFSD